MNMPVSQQASPVPTSVLLYCEGSLPPTFAVVLWVELDAIPCCETGPYEVAQAELDLVILLP